MGALTLKPFSDESREWELLENESVDVTDGFGAQLKVSVRENQIFLIEPYDVNMPWLSDRGRLFFEGSFNKYRGDTTDWSYIFDQINSTIYFLDHFKFCSFSPTKGDFTVAFKRISVENLEVLTRLQNNFSYVNLLVDRPFTANNDLEESYQLSTWTELPSLKFSSLLILIGINTRYENYALNLVLRQRFLKGNMTLMSIGPVADVTIPNSYIGSSSSNLLAICEGVTPVCREIAKATFPVLLTNSYVLKNKGLGSMHSVVGFLNQFVGLNINFSVVSDRIESTGINSLSRYKSLEAKDLIGEGVLYYLNMDLETNPDFKRFVNVNLLKTHYVEARGKTNFKAIFDHTDSPSTSIRSLSNITNYFYVPLPAKHFFGENSMYQNVFGRQKKSVKVVKSSKDSKSSWQILRYLYFSFGNTVNLSCNKDHRLLSGLTATTFTQGCYSRFTYRPTPTLVYTAEFLELQSTPFVSRNVVSSKNFKSTKVCFSTFKIKYWLDDFFTGGNKDVLSTKSATLVKCSAYLRAGSTNFF